MTGEPISQRLKKVRESMNLSLGDAASKLGYANYQTLSQIENGTREVKAAELLKFSKLYYCSLEYLLGQKQEDTATSYLLWRGAPDENDKQIIEKRVHYLTEECDWLLWVLNLKQKCEFKLLEVNKEDFRTNKQVDHLAKKISGLLGLGRRPALVLKDILEQDYSVKIFYESMGENGSAASMLHEQFGAVIIINSDEAPWRRNFDLAHELFHLITWKAITPEELKDPAIFEDIEKKADRFASTLLLPADEVSDEIDKKMSSEKRVSKADFVDIAREFGVSAPALAYRLCNIKLIDWETSNTIANDAEIKEINKIMRRKDWGPPPSSDLLINLAMIALRKGHISRGKFSELADIDRCDIDNFIEARGRLNSEGEGFEIMDS